MLLIFLTDVAGVKAADGSVMRWLNTTDIPALVKGSVVGGGMLPKLQACQDALRSGVGRVRILPASEAEVLPGFYQGADRIGNGGHGMTTLSSAQAAEGKLLVPTYDRHPLLLTHGKGVYIYDSDGNAYLDFLSGIGVNALGYSHPAITKAIAAQAGKLIHTSNLFFHEFTVELAARLTKASGLDRVFFCNSGTEAFEGALKLARVAANVKAKNGTRKWRVLAMEQSFHGRTFGSMATTHTSSTGSHSRPSCPASASCASTMLPISRRSSTPRCARFALKPCRERAASSLPVASSWKPRGR